MLGEQELLFISQTCHFRFANAPDSAGFRHAAGRGGRRTQRCMRTNSRGDTWIDFCPYADLRDHRRQGEGLGSCVSSQRDPVRGGEACGSVATVW